MVLMLRIFHVFRLPILLSVSLLLVTIFHPRSATAVRPFVTDDARIVYKGQIEVENYAGLTMARGEKPTVEARSLQGTSLTDRLEIIAGGFGFHYQGGQARPLDLLFQPKYVLYRSFGILPSISVAAATLFPLSGNRQQWNSYAMAHASWFLFNPQESADPYDNGLAIHVNLGNKGQYDSGLGGRYTSKLYWAAAFEVITFTRELRFLGEIFNGDPFSFEDEFPAFQTGFRWYKSSTVQVDMVFRGVRGVSEEARATTGTEIGPGWNYTIQMGLRFLFDPFQ
jgi:hypothetical protein